jgi:hypothetical protein
VSDFDDLPERGIPFFAVVDASGVAVRGSLTVAQLRARGMEVICEVDSSGSASGTSIATLRNRGINFFCPVDETGVAADATTSATLRNRGIWPACLVSATGVAQDGTKTIAELAARGIAFFCPLDESGEEIASGGGGGAAGTPMGLLLTLTYAS